MFFRKNTSASADKTYKIVAADDQADVRMVLERGLSAAGHTVITAEDGQDALEKIEKEKPDLVILDIMMPRLNGIQALQQIKQNPKTRNLPVMMLTGQSSDQEILGGYMFGADYYVTKPFALKTLLFGIQMLFKPDTDRPKKLEI